MRSILLGFVATLAAFAMASAAELPTAKPKPAEKTRTCMIGDQKGFLLRGSDTCVKLGGYISVGGAVGNVRP
jgi:Porin subfamily